MDFEDTRTIYSTSWERPHTQINVALRQRGWSGPTRDMSHVLVS